MPSIQINDETVVHINPAGVHGLTIIRWEGDTTAAVDSVDRQRLVVALGGRWENNQ